MMRETHNRTSSWPFMKETMETCRVPGWIWDIFRLNDYKSVKSFYYAMGDVSQLNEFITYRAEPHHHPPRQPDQH